MEYAYEVFPFAERGPRRVRLSVDYGEGKITLGWFADVKQARKARRQHTRIGYVLQD